MTSSILHILDVDLNDVYNVMKFRLQPFFDMLYSKKQLVTPSEKKNTVTFFTMVKIKFWTTIKF